MPFAPSPRKITVFCRWYVMCGKHDIVLPTLLMITVFGWCFSMLFMSSDIWEPPITWANMFQMGDILIHPGESPMFQQCSWILFGYCHKQCFTGEFFSFYPHYSTLYHYWWVFWSWLMGIWLVVWNIFYFSIYWECHHPNWRTYIFQRGRYTTSQVYSWLMKRLMCTCIISTVNLMAVELANFGGFKKKMLEFNVDGVSAQMSSQVWMLQWTRVYPLVN